jgi:transposase
MTKVPRKTYTVQFKAKIELEALREGVKTINEIAQEHGAHPVQVAQWKKKFKKMPAPYSKGSATRNK